MALSALSILVVAAGGGLGKAVVREALSRGRNVSVLVRSAAKYRADADVADVIPRLAGVYEGSGERAADVSAAITASGAATVFGMLGGNEAFARGCAQACKDAGAKFVFVAGETNVMQEDGVTPNWLAWKDKWPPAESAFRAHGAAIAAIRAVGANFIVFCPPAMDAKGAVSQPPPTIRVNRPSGRVFLSYEDAAWTMVEAAAASQYDGQLITAAPGARSEL